MAPGTAAEVAVCTVCPPQKTFCTWAVRVSLSHDPFCSDRSVFTDTLEGRNIKLCSFKSTVILSCTQEIILRSSGSLQAACFSSDWRLLARGPGRQRARQEPAGLCGGQGCCIALLLPGLLPLLLSPTCSRREGGVAFLWAFGTRPASLFSCPLLHCKVAK